MNSKSGGEKANLVEELGRCSNISTSSCGSLYGSDSRRMPLTMLKIAALAPIPIARVNTATQVNPGFRRNCRRPYLRSCPSWSIHGEIQALLESSRARSSFPIARRLPATASPGDSPAFASSCSFNERCVSISSASSCSNCRRFIQYWIRRSSLRITAPSGRLKDLMYGFDHPVEVLALGAKLFPAGRRQVVVAGAAVVFGSSPLGFKPAVQQKALEGGIQ